jgi:serine/threonine protein kinase/serine/threonine protein phosphatase PrpC
MHLSSGLRVKIGQISNKGLKPQNEDSIGFYVPKEPVLTIKGMVAIVADGVSSAEAGKEASETCVKNFLSDYFSTPDSWTVKTSGQRILTALNRWLYGQGMGFHSAEHGYISTLSAMVIKSRTAHIFHIGDSRVYRYRPTSLGADFEQITHDHAAKVSKDSTYLTRAMGMDLMLDVDYYTEEVRVGDLFFLSTDGIHDFIKQSHLKNTLTELLQQEQPDFQACCESILGLALSNESDDNLSCQLIHIDELPDANADDTYVKLSDLPFPPFLSPSMVVDGYKIISELHASNRSQVYLVEDIITRNKYVMKTPSVNYDEDIAYKERFVMEPWIAGRILSKHVVKVHNDERPQKFLYYVCDYVEGDVLSEWMKKNPKPGIDRVVKIVNQLIKGTRALHRKETLHQDIKPDNIIIGEDDHVTVIDFGSCYISGVAEIEAAFEREIALGTETYSAPEYKLRRRSSLKSDMFSIAVVMYEMLTGKLPYGDKFERCQSTNDFYRLNYHPARDLNPMVPKWMDGTLQKALQISPDLRYDALSEFVYDLEHPNTEFRDKSHIPISQRNPLVFWQGMSALLFILQITTLWCWLG